MIIENTRFGTIEIEDDKVIRIVRSMPGFPGRECFVILDRKESHPFLWLQCIDDPQLSFVILNPYLLIPDYSFDLKSAFVEVSWEEDNEENLSVFVIINASSGVPSEMTANLMAPLLINAKRFEAVQIILQDGSYSHRHLLFGTEN